MILSCIKYTTNILLITHKLLFITTDQSKVKSTYLTL